MLKGIGVAETINYKTEALADRIKKMTGDRGVDVVVDMDFSSTQRLVQERAVATHGTVVTYGSNSMEIGRESCRERECTYVWNTVSAVSLKKKIKRRTKKHQ